MPVTFSKATPLPNEDCFCFEPLTEDVVADENGHHFHLKCIQEWAKTSPHCPHCREEIDTSNILSLKDRATYWINKKGSDLIDSAISQFDLVFAIPGSLWGSMTAILTTHAQDDVDVVGFGMLAGAVAGVAAKQLYEQFTSRRMSSSAILGSSFLGSLGTTLILHNALNTGTPAPYIGYPVP